MLSVRPFRRLWLALALSSLGDWLGLLATTSLASTFAGSYSGKSFAIGGVLVVRLLPALALSPLAGAFADRFDRRVTMVVADVLRFSFFVSIPLVHSLSWLYAASFLVECFSLFWIPAKEASVPNLLRKDQLEAANQLSLITTYGTAPVAAGVFALLSLLSRVIGAGVHAVKANPVDISLYFDALTFAVSAVVIAGLREVGGRRAPRAARDPLAQRRSLLRAVATVGADIGQGWRFAGQTPLVRGLLLGMLGAFATGGVVIGAGRQYVDVLKGGNAAYGLLFGGVFLGLAAGMGLGPRLLRGLSRRRLFGLAIVFAGASVAVLAVLPNLVLALLVVLLVGFGAGIAWVTGYTLLGLEVVDEVRGRTFSLLYSLVRADLLVTIAATPVSVGLIGNHHLTLSNGSRIRLDGVTVTLFVAGLLSVVLGVVAFRQMDDRPGVGLLRDLAGLLRRKPGRPSYDGLFVAVEGGEGAGKSTQASRLAELFEVGGREVVCTREPGGTEAGRRLRALLLDPASEGLSARAEALLYAADRAEHVERVVRPALERGAVVITDRYVDSSLAYQGAGRELDQDDVGMLSRWATSGLTPDLTVLLDLDPQVGLGRAAGRTVDAAADRLEAESLDFHRRVRAGFLALAAAEPARYLVVDAAAAPDVVTEAVAGQLNGRVPGRFLTAGRTGADAAGRRADLVDELAATGLPGAVGALGAEPGHYVAQPQDREPEPGLEPAKGGR